MLDFDIEGKSEKIDFELKLGGGEGGLNEAAVIQIIEEQTKDLQPKSDDNLKTQSKNIVDAINELHLREDKQGLTESQVKGIVHATAVTEETDPTVPSWAKQPTKPTYTAQEVGALPSDTPLFSGEYNDLKNKPTIPSVEGFAKEKYVDEKVASGISTHNVETDSHKDIRSLIFELRTRLNSVADSDDTTLDQLSEIVAYIKANKTLIESITTSKVNVSDIVNDIESNITNKPLSAAQGVALKELINEVGEATIELEEYSIREVSLGMLEDNELSVELKDKEGNIVASAETTLPMPDLSDYVKNTDVVDDINEKYGLVKLKSYGQGGLKVSAGGYLTTQSPSISLIKSRDSVRPLVSANIDEVMWVGVTGFRTIWNGSSHVPSYGNQKPLTDEEKTSACDWLGAVTKKELDAINTAIEAILGV